MEKKYINWIELNDAHQIRILSQQLILHVKEKTPILKSAWYIALLHGIAMANTYHIVVEGIRVGYWAILTGKYRKTNKIMQVHVPMLIVLFFINETTTGRTTTITSYSEAKPSLSSGEVPTQNIYKIVVNLICWFFN